MKSMGDRLSVLFATGLGLGYAPIASGTVGTFWGVLFVVIAWNTFAATVGIQILCGAVLSLMAIPICGRAEAFFGKKDDGRIVADEYMTFPLCLIGLPVTLSVWWMLPIAFLTCRFFDIVKPPPIRQLQALHGGFGIVIDDVLASLLSLAVNHAIFFAAQKLLG